jgi:hypothetical protein
MYVQYVHFMTLLASLAMSMSACRKFLSNLQREERVQP